MVRLSRRYRLLAGLLLTVVAACTSPIGSDAPALAPPPADPGSSEPALPLAPASPSPTLAPSDLRYVKQLLIASAHRHGVNPYLVMGVAWWESGWNQSAVSSTGAVGIMQVEPATAQTAGPLLLHRVVDIHDPADNIDVGTAVLKEDLDHFNNDMTKALIAYYAGPAAVTDWNDQDEASRRYVWGVYRLALAFSNGTGPA